MILRALVHWVSGLSESFKSYIFLAYTGRFLPFLICPDSLWYVVDMSDAITCRVPEYFDGSCLWSIHSLNFLQLGDSGLERSRHGSPLPAYDSIDWDAPDTSAIRVCAWVRVLKVQGMNVEKPFKRIKRLKKESGQGKTVAAVARSHLFYIDPKKEKQGEHWHHFILHYYSILVEILRPLI